MNCPPLLKYARFLPPRHVRRMALSPPFLSCLAPLKDKWQPPSPLPPLCGRQVAMLLAFTVGRHTQKIWVRKDSVPLWTPCLSTLTRRVSMSRRSSPLTSVTVHNIQPKSKGGLIALQHQSVHVGVSEWGLEGKYSTSRVHIFLYLREVIKTQHATKREERANFA